MLTLILLSVEVHRYIHDLLIYNFLPCQLISEKSAKLIDHIYYYEDKNSKWNFIIKSDNLINDLTYHLPNYTIILKKINQNLKTDRWLAFTKSTKLKFATDVASTNWSDIYNYQDANDAYNAFSTRICKLFENNFPLTKLSRAKLRDEKWITFGLRKSSRP